MIASSQKGLITEIQCELNFTKYGIILSKPITNDCRYDYIADINGKLYRIQCKAAAISQDGSFIQFGCHSTNIRNNTEYCYTDADIDYFYTEYNGQGYLVPVNQGGKRNKVLRFSAKQNHSTIMWAEDFTLEKILKEELNYDFENSTWSNTVLTR